MIECLGRALALSAGTVFVAVLSLWCVVLSGEPPHVLAAAGNVATETGERPDPARPARRVIIIPPLLASYLTVDRTAAHILALSPSQQDAVMAGLIGRIYPSIATVPAYHALDDTPAVPEELMLLKPDALFTWPWKAELLRRIDFPGLFDIHMYDGNNPDHGAIAMLSEFGRVAGHPGMARAVTKRYVDRYRTIGSFLTDAAIPRPSVAILFDRHSRSLAGSSFPLATSYLEPLGAKLAANSGAYAPISVERLLLLDPDVIFIDSDGDDDTPASLYDRPGWQALRAVQRKRVYRTLNLLDHNEIVEGSILLQWMAEILYPQKMPKQLRGLFRTTFRDTYSYTISDDEIDQAIFLKENAISADYRRFLRK